MICSRCQHEVPEGARFCPGCGTAAGLPPPGSGAFDTLSDRITGSDFSAPPSHPVAPAEAYRNAVRLAVQDGHIAPAEESLLAQLRSSLGLTPAEAARIREEVTGIAGGGDAPASLDIAALPIGMSIGDRFVLGPRLGSGGMGAVYRVTHRRTHKDRAIKVLVPHLAANQSALAALEEEVALAQELKHENLCAVFSLDHEQGLTFILMEYIDGKNLAVLLRERGRLRVQELLPIAHGMLAGLHYLHEKGYVHKDVKPQNVMLTRGGQVKLVDYGIATSIREQLDGAGALGRSGTPHYMAPEQIRGEVVDRTADIYAVGVMFYELLAGRLPFDAKDREGAIAWHLQGEVRLPRFANDRWNAFFARCLARDPRRRFRNCLQLMDVLEAVASTGEPGPHGGGSVPAGASGSRRPPLPDIGVDQAGNEYIARHISAWTDTDADRIKGPLPQHPDNVAADCRRLLSNRLFDTRGLHRMDLLRAGGLHARFKTNLAVLEKWAYHYPEYRADYLAFANEAAPILGTDSIDATYFDRVDVVRRHSAGSSGEGVAEGQGVRYHGPVDPTTPPIHPDDVPHGPVDFLQQTRSFARSFGESGAAAKVVVYALLGCGGCSVLFFLLVFLAGFAVW